MSEYVKREEAIKVIQDYGKGAISDGMTALGPVDDIVELARAMERLDAADVAPVRRGHWEKDRDFIKCSACGFGMYPNYPRFMDGACVGTGYSEPNYCPNCGAKMDGGPHADDHD